MLNKSVLAVVIAVCLGSFNLNANVGKPNATVTKSYIVIEHSSGKILDSYNSNLPQYPASLTKLMTLYILFDEIKAKRISMRDEFTVSQFAASQVPSKIGLKEGEKIKVSEAINAMIVKSANDVAIVIAENIAGSADDFAKMMNEKAISLNLTHTNFVNPSGLPHKKQVTTARDMAILAKSIIDNHNDFYYLFSQKKATIKSKVYRNHNTLLGTYGIDGLKTGYISASGFHIAISSENSGVRLTAVYMGYESSTNRNQTAQDIIKTNFKETIYAKLKQDINNGSFYTPEFLVTNTKPQNVLAQKAPAQKNLNLDTKFLPTEAKVVGIEEEQKPNETVAIVKQPLVKQSLPVQQRVSSEEVMKDMIQVSTPTSNVVKTTTNLPKTTKAVASQPSKLIVNNKQSENNQARNTTISNSYYIQLGAFSSQDTAQTIILQAKKLVGIVRQNSSTVEKVQLRDGKKLYRAIINTKNESQAKQACGVIKNSGNECIVKIRRVSVEI